MSKGQLPNKIALYFHEVKRDEFDKLEAIINLFKNNEYNFVGSEEFVRSTNKVIFLSFDDNYFSWVNTAEQLAKKNILTTFFINTSPLRDTASKSEISNYAERINYKYELKTLSSNEIKYIYDLGHYIGGHSHSHFNLNKISFNDAIVEIEKNKQMLEDIIKNNITAFSYPYGMRRFFNTDLRNYCLKIGYSMICNAIPGMQFSIQERTNIFRTPWHLEKKIEYNMDNIKIDGRYFELITGRSAVG